MKKKLLICFALMMASAVSVFAQESEQEQTEVDSLVISKVVRFAKDLADTYQSIQNPYGTSASNGVSSSGLGGGDSAEPVTSDTLVVTRVDNNSTHSIVSADTVFFRHAADPYHPTLKDSVFVTRFTRSLQTGEPSSDTNYLKLDLKMSGTLKIYARPVGNYNDRTIRVTQYGQTLLEDIVSDEKTGTESVDLDFFGQSMAIGGVNIDMGENGKFNYNLTNPQSNKTMADVDVYPVLSVRVAEGEAVIEYPVGTMKIYGVEIIQTPGSENVKPALLVYPGKDGIIKNGVENDFLNTSYDSEAVPAIGFSAAYTENSNNIEMFVPGQFKKGDVIRITGVYYSDNEKEAKLSVFTVENGNLALVAPTELLINAKTSRTAPVEEVFTLTRDYERLFIGRNDNTTGTTVYLTALRVEGNRTAEELEAFAAMKEEFEAERTAREDLIPLQEEVDALAIPEEVTTSNYSSVKKAVAEAEAAIADAKNAVQNVSDIIDAGDISTTNKTKLEEAFDAAKQAIADAKQAIADAKQAYEDAKNAQVLPGDITGTGEVTSEDFDNFAQQLIDGTLPEEGDENFERYDANGDGYVDISDLQAILNLSMGLNADGSSK